MHIDGKVHRRQIRVHLELLRDGVYIGVEVDVASKSLLLPKTADIDGSIEGSLVCSTVGSWVGDKELLPDRVGGDGLVEQK